MVRQKVESTRFLVDGEGFVMKQLLRNWWRGDLDEEAPRGASAAGGNGFPYSRCTCGSSLVGIETTFSTAEKGTSDEEDRDSV